MKNILILDGFNNFIRAFVANPSMSTSGEAIGGIIGFLKILQKYCKEYKPYRVFVCWDGVGGSAFRKNLLSEYKQNRKPARLNRFSNNLPDDEIEKNKIWQLQRLLQYLENLPLIQLNCDHVEADDLIAWLSREYSDEFHCHIVSNDKDFIQLVSDTVTQHRATSKEILTPDDVKRIYEIHPNNFCLVKSICGDVSDNISGISGAGFKTISKRIPEVLLEERLTLDNLRDLCDARSKLKKAPKIFAEILNSFEIVERNLPLICLDDHDLSQNSKQKILYDIENFLPSFSRIGFFKLISEDGVYGENFENLFNWAQNLKMELKND